MEHKGDAVVQPASVHIIDCPTASGLVDAHAASVEAGKGACSTDDAVRVAVSKEMNRLDGDTLQTQGGC
jgi:hypothetical protein